jgi:hypothetical protein
MKRKYRATIRKALNWQGRRDARLGLMPRLDGIEYRAGYSIQYTREQIRSEQVPF